MGGQLQLGFVHVCWCGFVRHCTFPGRGQTIVRAACEARQDIVSEAPGSCWRYKAEDVHGRPDYHGEFIDLDRMLGKSLVML